MGRIFWCKLGTQSRDRTRNKNFLSIEKYPRVYRGYYFKRNMKIFSNVKRYDSIFL